MRHKYERKFAAFCEAEGILLLKVFNEIEMKKNLDEDKIIVSGKAKRFFAAPADSLDEELRKIVRRAVKSVAVPADLELRAMNLLRNQL